MNAGEDMGMQCYKDSTVYTLNDPCSLLHKYLHFIYYSNGKMVNLQVP